MPVKFFGQFLVEEGEIDDAQLEAALSRMEEVNLPIGRLAMRTGHLCEEDVRRIVVMQRKRDAPFGRIAVELGLIDERALERILHEQSETHVYLGEALVQMGAITADRLPVMLDRYKALEDDYDPPDCTLPPEVRDHPFVSVVLEMLPRMVLRVIHVQLKVDAATSWPSSGAPLPIQTHLVVATDPFVWLGLAADGGLGEQVATRMLGCEPADLAPGEVEDALGELLNLIAGNAKTRLEQDGAQFAMDAPVSGRLPPEGWALRLATTGGEGLLVVEVG